jgi:hypothetical protein
MGSLDIAHQLFNLLLGVGITLLVVHLISDITVKLNTEVGVIRSWVLIGSLETVIWHLVGLNSNVDIGAIILTSDAKLASVCARIFLSEVLRAGALWAHHLACARHLSTLMRIQIDRSGQGRASVVEEGGHGLAVFEGSSDASCCSTGLKESKVDHSRLINL